MDTITTRIDRLSPEKRKVLQELMAAGAIENNLEAGVGDPILVGTEGVIAQIWAEVLQVKRVGRDDNFFDLGGDSIHSIQIIAKLHKAGICITNQELFEHSTIGELAAAVDAGLAGQPEPAAGSGDT